MQWLQLFNIMNSFCIKDPISCKSCQSVVAAVLHFDFFILYLKTLSVVNHARLWLQLCYIMTAITICVRVDAYSMLYAVLLGVLMLLSRRSNARVWPIYCILLVILLPVQYLLALGLPVGLCYRKSR